MAEESNNPIAELAKGFASAILEKIVEPMLKTAKKTVIKGWGIFSSDFDLAYCKYLKNAYKKYSKAKTLLYRYEPQPLEDFFVVPDLRRRVTIPIHEEQVENYDLDRTITVTETNVLLDISQFIIIQGIGGIGKSTLMKFLFLNEIKQKDLIPIFFELKDINNFEEGYTIEELFFKKLSNLGSTLNEECMDYALSSGCFLFLLDGYDEIHTDKREVFFRRFEEFCDRYNENYYIISSRPFSNFIEMQRFTVLETCPFTEQQAIELIRKLKYDSNTKERFISSLISGLFDKHESFASNPLLLTIMLLTYDSYADIPNKMHIFYANAFETLFQKHDATKAGYKREIKSGLPFDIFKNIFARFCFLSYVNGLLEFTRDDLFTYLCKESRYSFNIDFYIYDLLYSICVLTKDGLSYRFVHRSFQEYFTAFYLKELTDENMKKVATKLMIRDAKRTEFDNVFSMLFNMTTERVEKNIILPFLEEFETDVINKSNFYYSKIIQGFSITPVLQEIIVQEDVTTLIFKPTFLDNSMHFIQTLYECYNNKDFAIIYKLEKLPGSSLKKLIDRFGKEDYDLLNETGDLGYIARVQISSIVTFLSGLIDMIKQKQKEETEELTNLLE
ncbi:MAG: NACHT domain-containing protein [Clostridia bacterium]|nr:NACHT domain-containing protein [Clostridia bacterium]